MTNKDRDNLKLVYVLKVGVNSKKEGIYEFIFSKNLDVISENYEGWLWDESPASIDGNALPPEEKYIDKVLELKTNKFNLFCLHDSNDHSYLDGVYTIHCLAYEKEDDETYNIDIDDDYEDLFYSEEENEYPILVFHYGMSLKTVEDMLYERDITLKESKIGQL